LSEERLSVTLEISRFSLVDVVADGDGDADSDDDDDDDGDDDAGGISSLSSKATFLCE